MKNQTYVAQRCIYFNIFDRYLYGSCNLYKNERSNSFLTANSGKVVKLPKFTTI